MYKNITSFVAQGTNSGKTYIIERIIEELKNRGRKVAAIKHSMHLPSIDKEGKDTYKFAQKGADRIILFSDNALMLYEMSQPDIEYLTFLATKNIDIILVEGFKSGPFKKIEVFNNTLYDKPMCLEDPSGEYIALISREEVPVKIPNFSFEDLGGICSFLETRAGL
jgi:molybdopterin-guanine dinucleotide biosynthesis protein B